MTYFNFIRLGWDSFINDFIYLSWRHSSRVEYFYFIFLMATIYCSGLIALNTVPKLPSPIVFTILYFYIDIINSNDKNTDAELSIYELDIFEGILFFGCF